MTHDIHPTAIIHPNAKIGANVKIGPYSIVGEHVTLGDDVVLHSHVVLEGDTTIGAGTKIFPFASIGHAPQDLKFHGENSRLIIGKNNTIREHVTMNPGTEHGGMETRVGDNGLFMTACHIAHDCQIGNNVILANNATLAGHVTLGDFAFVGGLAAVHQFIRIGAHAVIGGMSGVESDVIPYGRVKGERAFLAGLNLIGLERRGFTKDDIRMLQKAYNQLFADDGTFEQRMEQVTKDYADQPQIMELITFAREKSRFPLCQPSRKAA